MDATADWYRNLENWKGSSLELAIDLGGRDDGRLRAAFAAAWASPSVVGPRASPYPDPHRGASDDQLDPQGSTFTYGTIQLPNTGGRLGCVVLSVRDETSDWLDVAVPTGMLEVGFDVRYPLLDETNSWIAGVERHLVSIADAIYSVVPFDLATVGEEVSGLFHAPGSDVDLAIRRDDVDRRGGFVISPGLWERLRPTVAAELRTTGLRWVPPRG